MKRHDKMNDHSMQSRRRILASGRSRCNPYLDMASITSSWHALEDIAIAVANDRAAEVKRLLAAGADPSMTDRHGDPLLVIAVRERRRRLRRGALPRPADHRLFRFALAVTAATATSELGLLLLLHASGSPPLRVQIVFNLENPFQYTRSFLANATVFVQWPASRVIDRDQAHTASAEPTAPRRPRWG